MLKFKFIIIKLLASSRPNNCPFNDHFVKLNIYKKNILSSYPPSVMWPNHDIAFIKRAFKLTSLLDWTELDEDIKN